MAATRPVLSVNRARFAKRKEWTFTGAQTDLSLLGAISATERVMIHGGWVSAAGNAAAVSYRLGFTTAATLPATSNTTGTDDMVSSHPGLAAGGGKPIDPAMGAKDQELRFTCSTPSTGSCVVELFYEIIKN